MKQYLCLILLAANCGCVFAQTQPGLPEHTLNITLKVEDEQHDPLPRVNAGVGFFTNSQPTSIDGITDTNGLFVASQTVEPSGGGYTFGFSAEKDGYYTTRAHFNLDTKYDAVKWNPTVTMTLKKIGKPVAMYAKHVLQLKFPEFNKAIGFDLMIGDWVGPYGKGVNADLLLTQHHTNPQSGYPITLSFPNIGDGIQEFTLQESDKGSGLRSGHEAPSEGYQATIAQTVITNPNRNFYFRVRTKLDENGKVVSARYGKIYGDLAQFTYYFNPTPNDRNIEFDPKQNLFGGLQSFEQVTAP